MTGYSIPITDIGIWKVYRPLHVLTDDIINTLHPMHISYPGPFILTIFHPMKMSSHECTFPITDLREGIHRRTVDNTLTYFMHHFINT